MAYTKDYETVIPLPRDEETATWLASRGYELGHAWPLDDDEERLLVFLVWESFAKAAGNFALELVEFNDAGQVDPDDIPPEWDQQLGRPARDFVWRKFTGLARRPAWVNRELEQELAARRATIEQDNERHAESG